MRTSTNDHLQIQKRLLYCFQRIKQNQPTSHERDTWIELFGCHVLWQVNSSGDCSVINQDKVFKCRNYWEQDVDANEGQNDTPDIN